MANNSSGTYITETFIKEKEKKESPPRLNSPLTKAPTKFPRTESPDDKDDYEWKEKKWKQVLEKIEFTPNPSDYYHELPIKPGFHFYKALASSRYPLDSLRVNIPETIVSIDSAMYVIYTDDSGHVQRKSDATYLEFEQKMMKAHEELKSYCAELLKIKYPAKELRDEIEFGKTQPTEKKSLDPQAKEAYQRDKEKDKEKARIDKLMEQTELEEDKYYEKADKNEKKKIEATLKFFLKKIKKSQEMPLLITRSPFVQDQTCTKFVMSYRAHKERKAGNLENNKLEQRFIFSKARRASIMRMVYNTRNSKSFNANYGIRITNFIYLCNEDTKKYQAKVAIATENQNSFEINIVKGFGLAEYEVYCERVVCFLEKAYSVRVSQVVLDFINDIQDKIWLINMKSIRLETCVTRSDMQEGEGKKTLDELSCTVSCKLCGSFFKKDEANKVLTYKLLWELVQHLKKRGNPLKKIKAVSHSSTRPCRVCNTCYMLVVGEHELIEIEKSFARFQNIPINDDEIRVQIDTKPKHRPALLKEELFQWRLLFFINDIQGIDPTMNLDFKNIYFHYKLHNFKTSFPVQCKYSRTSSQDSVDNSQMHDDSKFGAESKKRTYSKGQSQSVQSPTYPHKKLSLFINMIRVHYFFSETLDIEKFLTDTEIKIRLSNGNNWNNFLAEGTSKSVSLFRNKLKSGQRHQSKVLCFFESANYCSLNIQAGLVCDGTYQTENLNLYKFNQIYFPDESFYNTNYFPDEWMEMFDPTSVKIRDEIEGMMDYEKYSPKCSPEDLKKMIDLEGYKGNSTVRGHEAKLGRSQSAQRFPGKDTQSKNSVASKNVRTIESQNVPNHDDDEADDEISERLKLRPFTAVDGNKIIDPIQPIHRQSGQNKPKPSSSKPKLEYKSAQKVLLDSQAVRDRTQEEQNVLKRYSVFDEDELLDEDENPEMKGRQTYLINKINKDLKESSSTRQLDRSTKDMNRSSQNFNNTSKTAKPGLPSVGSLKAGNQVDSTTFKSYLNEKKSKVSSVPKGKKDEL